MSFPLSPTSGSSRLQGDSNLVILNLPYSFLVDSKEWHFGTNTGLWQGQFEWSKALVPYAVLSQHQFDSIRIIDNIGSLRDTVMSLNYNGVSDMNHIKLIEPQLNNQLITVSINGNETFINNCRTEILATYSHVGFKKIALTDGRFNSIGANFILTINCIASRYAVEILIGPYDTDFKSNCTACSTNNVYILGSSEKLSFAVTDVRVAMDTLLGGCLVNKISVPLSMVPALGGPNMANFAELSRESNVSIYLPYMLPSLKEMGMMKSSEEMSIWFSSESVSEVILCNSILCQLRDVVDPRSNKAASLFRQEVKVSKEKMDLLLLYHKSDILSIMFKHGTFILVPELGELQDDLVVVQGSTLESLQETLAALATLCSKFYTFELSFAELAGIPPDLEYYFITLLSLKKCCVLTFNENGLRYVGSKAEIFALVNDLVNDITRNSLFAKLIKGTDFNASIAMEIANDQRDFMTGKKNGKIIKILNQVKQISSIHFEPFSSLNFIIRLSIFYSSKQDNCSALKLNILSRTLTLLELEVPAEQKFHIPEAFHKSIIGNGGQVIQSIMKKYNVFIKFVSNTQEAKKGNSSTEVIRNLYSLHRRDNVIIKCPMKNLKNIEFAKYEIDHLMMQCCHNSIMTTYGTSVVYNTVKFNLLKSHYQLLIRSRNYDLKFISDLEQEHSSYIAFPRSLEEFKDQSSLSVMIKGNDSKARLCALNLASLLPFSREFSIKHSPQAFYSLMDNSNTELRNKIVIPFRLILDCEFLVLPLDFTSVGKAGHLIMLNSYSRENLETASLELVQFLQMKGLVLLEQRDAEFDPILSIEESTSPRKQLPSKLSRTPSHSPEKQQHPKSSSRSHSNFNSSVRLDADIVPVPFDLSYSKAKPVTVGKRKNISPFRPITNHSILSVGVRP